MISPNGFQDQVKEIHIRKKWSHYALYSENNNVWISCIGRLLLLSDALIPFCTMSFVVIILKVSDHLTLNMAGNVTEDKC